MAFARTWAFVMLLVCNVLASELTVGFPPGEAILHYSVTNTTSADPPTVFITLSQGSNTTGQAIRFYFTSAGVRCTQVFYATDGEHDSTCTGNPIVSDYTPSSESADYTVVMFGKALTLYGGGRSLFKSASDATGTFNETSLSATGLIATGIRVESYAPFPNDSVSIDLDIVIGSSADFVELFLLEGAANANSPLRITLLAEGAADASSYVGPQVLQQIPYRLPRGNRSLKLMIVGSRFVLYDGFSVVLRLDGYSVVALYDRLAVVDSGASVTDTAEVANYDYVDFMYPSPLPLYPQCSVVYFSLDTTANNADGNLTIYLTPDTQYPLVVFFRVFIPQGTASPSSAEYEYFYSTSVTVTGTIDYYVPTQSGYVNYSIILCEDTMAIYAADRSVFAQRFPSAGVGLAYIRMIADSLPLRDLQITEYNCSNYVHTVGGAQAALLDIDESSTGNGTLQLVFSEADDGSGASLVLLLGAGNKTSYVEVRGNDTISGTYDFFLPPDATSYTVSVCGNDISWMQGNDTIFSYRALSSYDSINVSSTTGVSILRLSKTASSCALPTPSPTPTPEPTPSPAPTPEPTPSPTPTPEPTPFSTPTPGRGFVFYGWSVLASVMIILPLLAGMLSRHY